MVAIRPKTRRRQRHRRAIEANRAQVEQIRTDIRELGRLGQPVIAGEREGVVDALMENRRQLLQTSTRGPVPAVAPLDLDRWVLWRPSSEDVREVRVGALREGVDGDSLGVPCVVPFERGRAIVVVNRNDRQRETAAALWSALVMRIAALSAGRAEMVLIDPMRSTADPRLFTRVVSGVEVPAELDRLLESDVSPNGRVIAVANAPHGFGSREVATLMAMIRSGAGGATLVVHLDLERYRAAIGEPDFGGESSRWIVDVGVTDVDGAGSTTSVEWDSAPSGALVDLVVERLSVG